MNPEQIRAFALETTEELFAKQNIDAVDKYFTENFVNHNPVQPTVCNREDYKQWIRTLTAAFPNTITVTLDAILVEGDKYAVCWIMHCIGQGEFRGVDVTGKEVTLSGIVIQRLADDKIAEQWWAYDNLGLLQQLGIISLPGQAAKA